MAALVRLLQENGRVAMVVMVVSVTAIFFNSPWGQPPVFFQAILRLGKSVSPEPTKA